MSARNLPCLSFLYPSLRVRVGRFLLCILLSPSLIKIKRVDPQRHQPNDHTTLTQQIDSHRQTDNVHACGAPACLCTLVNPTALLLLPVSSPQDEQPKGRLKNTSSPRVPPRPLLTVALPSNKENLPGAPPPPSSPLPTPSTTSTIMDTVCKRSAACRCKDCAAASAAFSINDLRALAPTRSIYDEDDMDSSSNSAAATALPLPPSSSRPPVCASPPVGGIKALREQRQQQQKAKIEGCTEEKELVVLVKAPKGERGRNH